MKPLSRREFFQSAAAGIAIVTGAQLSEGIVRPPLPSEEGQPPCTQEDVAARAHEGVCSCTCQASCINCNGKGCTGCCTYGTTAMYSQYPEYDDYLKRLKI